MSDTEKDTYTSGSRKDAIFRKIGMNISQLAMPLIALSVLLIFNLIRDPSFFSIGIATDAKGSVLTGNLISVLCSASVLAIIAMGMTLVTASCGGQDISVGAVGAIAGAFFVIMLHPEKGSISTLTDFPGGNVVLGVLAAVMAAVIFTLFNGVLVSVFKIQPMIATLILFCCGRSIAYYFLFQVFGAGSVKLVNPIIEALGIAIPGIPIPTPILIMVAMELLLLLVFKLTNIRLYTQSVGINQKAARLNGINPTVVKLLSFAMLGMCVAVASVVKISNLGTLTTKSLLDSIEMDAILAVAIGGNNLGGGKFRLSGSVIGAFTIQMLTTTLNAMQVDPESMRAYKAIVIIVIMVAGSPVFKTWLSALKNRRKAVTQPSGLREVT